MHEDRYDWAFSLLWATGIAFVAGVVAFGFATMARDPTTTAQLAASVSFAIFVALSAGATTMAARSGSSFWSASSVIATVAILTVIAAIVLWLTVLITFPHGVVVELAIAAAIFIRTIVRLFNHFTEYGFNRRPRDEG